MFELAYTFKHFWHGSNLQLAYFEEMFTPDSEQIAAKEDCGAAELVTKKMSANIEMLITIVEIVDIWSVLVQIYLDMLIWDQENCIIVPTRAKIDQTI